MTVIAARYANASHSAIVATTAERGDILVSAIDTPALWAAVRRACTPTPFG